MTGEDRRQDRLELGTKLVVLAVALLAIGVYGGLIVALLTRGDSTELVSQGDQQACMSTFNGVKEAAANEVARVDDRRDDLYDQAQIAIAVNDDQALGVIVAEQPRLHDELVAARRKRDQTLREYLDAAYLRMTDPVKFLEACENLPGR